LPETDDAAVYLQALGSLMWPLNSIHDLGPGYDTRTIRLPRRLGSQHTARSLLRCHAAFAALCPELSEQRKKS
jgi:hypothetical protein